MTSLGIASCGGGPHPRCNLRLSTGGDYHRSIAATSLGVADRIEGHANAFSKHTNCFSSPLAIGTVSFLDRRNPPRKCTLKECSPAETWYTLICLGEMAPTFEPSRKTLTTPPSPIARLRRWPRPRPSRDAARTTTRVGNEGQIRFGARHSRMVAPTWSSTPREVSPPLVAAPTSDLSPSRFRVLFSVSFPPSASVVTVPAPSQRGRHLLLNRHSGSVSHTPVWR